MPTEVACPSCDCLLRVPADLLGRPVKCPTCGNMFTAMGAEPISPTGITARGEAVRMGPEPGSMQIQEAAAPVSLPHPPAQMRKLGEDYLYRDRRSAARSKVNAPASALLVVGILALAFSLFGIVLHAAIGLGALADDQQSEEKAIVGLVVSVCGLAYGGLVLAGALKMKILKNYGLAVTASIVAMLPCYGFCCVIGLPFGIWALVELMRPDVRDAFH